jgi:hypothetical protein
MDAVSLTCAAVALYDTQRASLDEYLRAGAGAARRAVHAARPGPRARPVRQRRTVPALLPKLVKSSALDAVPSDGANGDWAAAQRFLEVVAAAELERFPAIEEGEDLRLESPAVAGGALLAEARLLHLCAFSITTAAADDAGGAARGSRIARASQRRSSRP